MPQNRLIQERSPYLLQHANNPVDWYPWGEEAFEKARKEDKPIFLSVGYSTCHWCHVMERESFESEEIAAQLNRSFVSIKVDREERPDVDRIYMLFIQLTSGGGGWPMSVWLTPSLKPFYGGTYFPPDNRYGRPGFRALLQYLADSWRTDRKKIEETSTNALGGLQRYLERGNDQTGLDIPSALDAGFQHLRRSFDSVLGGFGAAPKFPRPSTLNFLFRYYDRSGSIEARDMALLTLREMARGGMNDQLGGGFHRYSVDERWFVPHFEKMLYDQAQLAVSYLEAFQITGDESFAAIARNTLDYVLKDMTLPEGAFLSAEDADSAVDSNHPHEKQEGAFYVWTQAEIGQATNVPARDWFCFAYGVEPGGNVEHDPHGEFSGRNIFYQAHSAQQTAQHFSVPIATVQAGLEECRLALLGKRVRRPRPHLDDKVLTSWNGLMISAFAKAAQVLEDDRYRDAAVRAVSFLREHLFDASSGRALRRYRDGNSAINGFLDDYAFWIQALIDVYETVLDVEHLEFALRLMEIQDAHFFDAESGAYFSSESNDPSLVLRIRDDYDGAEPSGNSVSLSNLIRLFHLTGKDEFRVKAEHLANAFATPAREQPSTIPQFLAGLALLDGPVSEIVLAANGQGPSLTALLRTLHQRFVPRHVLIGIIDQRTREFFAPGLPSVVAMTPLNGEAAAYVCENYACQLPVTDSASLSGLLENRRSPPIA